MLELSQEYKNSIISMFPDRGAEWLANIPNIIDKYTKEFELSNVRVNHGLTYNVILFADSKKYGEVVLKIEIPYEEMTIGESVALELNDGKGACKCLYKNIPEGVLLLEKLSPGYSLNKIDNLEDRVRIFANVSKRFNVKVKEDCGLRTYSNIFNRSTSMVLSDKKFAEIEDLVIVADTIYKNIEAKNDNNYLLHSDLYSDNIIMSGDTFKAIDPHGFIGNKIIDTAILAQKELDKIGYDSQSIDYMLGLLAKYCEYDKLDLANAFYVNYVLNICWDREVNIINDESIVRANAILDYINNYKNNLDNDKSLARKRNG